MPTKPWEYLAVDYLGPLPSGDHLLVIVDYFSCYKEVYFTKSTTTTITIKFLKRLFAIFGFPERVKSDNGTNLVSKEMMDCEEYGVDPITTPAEWPRANGEVERQNQSLLKRLKIAQLEGKDLEYELIHYLLCYRSTCLLYTLTLPTIYSV